MLGDAEELWKESPASVIDWYEEILRLERKFREAGGTSASGATTTTSGPVRQLRKLNAVLSQGPMGEALKIRVRGRSDCRLFLVHGHQGTTESDKWGLRSKPVVRVVWRQVQRMTDGRAPRWPTFGITLIPPLPIGNARLFPGLGLMRRGPLHLLECLLTTMMVGHDQADLRKPWVAARSIAVDTERVNVVDFDIEPAAQRALYDNGRVAAERFMATWDWEDYLRRYRGPSDPGEANVDVGELREPPAVEHVGRDLHDEALGRAPDRYPADDQDSLR